jgi:hypothetical protein
VSCCLFSHVSCVDLLLRDADTLAVEPAETILTTEIEAIVVIRSATDTIERIRIYNNKPSTEREQGKEDTR